MSKLKFQIKFKFQISNMKTFDMESFNIHLEFACLPCLPQAGAGRDFDIWDF
jgi:hypothetical protein